MAAKKSTVRVVAVAVKDAALAVGHAADDHVIHPVGEALGLIKKKGPTGKSEKKAARKEIVKAAEKKKSPAAKTMTGSMKLLQPTKKSGSADRGPAAKSSRAR